MDNDNRTLDLVNPNEAGNIQRAVIAWIVEGTGYTVDFEYLGEYSGLCVSTIQAANKTKTYILGGYEAQYQFAVYRRLYAENNDARIEADEELNMLSAWLEENPPTLPAGIRFKRLRRDSNAALLGRYDNGVEDHSITFTLFYEVV